MDDNTQDMTTDSPTPNASNTAGVSQSPDATQGPAVGSVIPQGATVGGAIPQGSNIGAAPASASASMSSQPDNSPSVGGAIPQGAKVGDAIPQGATIGEASSQNSPEEPSFLSRVGEGSGVTGTASLVKQIAQRPIDIYHEAVSQAKAGDWKAASETASKILYGGMADKDNPIWKAAEQLIMQPIKEIEASYKQNREAGEGVGKAALETAESTLTGSPTTAESAATDARLNADYKNRDYSALIGDIIGGAGTSHGVSSIPLLGGMIKQTSGNLDTDLHAHNYSAAAGDVLGPMLTLGLGKVLGAASRAGEVADDVVQSGVKDVRPTSTKIAGVDIPQAAKGTSVLSKDTASIASKRAADEFVQTQVQPAAIQATHANFIKSALDSVDELHQLQGTAGVPPVLHTVDDIANYLQGEAKRTYSKLDAAGQAEVDAWDQQYGNQAPAQGPTGAARLLSGGPAPTRTIVPPRPRLFTELQDQIKDASRIIDSPFASQVDKEAAIQDLPRITQERDAFLGRHANVVDPGELAAANKTWSQAYRYEFLADKLRTLTKGGGAGTGETGTIPNMTVQALDTIPSRFDNKFGVGSFEELMGREGIENFDKVLKALKQPEVGGTFLKWITQSFYGTAKVGAIPAQALADRLLFDPEFGSRAVALYRAAKTGTNYAKKAADAVIKAQTASMPVTAKKQDGGSLKTALSGTKSSLGGASTNPNQAEAYVTPSYKDGKVPGMVQPGNVNLNNRPDIKNPDGSHSSVYSMSFSTDKGEVLVPGVGDGKTYPLRQLTTKEALDQYRKTGNNLGTFKTPQDADTYGEKLHEDQANR